MYHPANTNTDLAALAKKILDVNQTHFMITARPRLASRDFVSLNLNAVVWSYGMTNIQHEIQEGGRQAGSGSQFDYNSVLCNQPGLAILYILTLCIWLHGSILWLCSPSLHSDSERYLEEGFPWSSLVWPQSPDASPSFKVSAPPEPVKTSTPQRFQFFYQIIKYVISNKFISQRHSQLSPKMHFQRIKSISQTGWVSPWYCSHTTL